MNILAIEVIKERQEKNNKIIIKMVISEQNLLY